MTHILCHQCALATQGYFEFDPDLDNVPRNARLHCEISIARSFRFDDSVWSRGDKIIGTFSPEGAPDEIGITTWHVRLANVSRKTGERHAALCRLPESAYTILPREGELRAPCPAPSSKRNALLGTPASWQRFIPRDSGGEGHWTREAPTEVGTYLVRGHRHPSHLHSIRVIARSGQCVYLDDSDHEFDIDTLLAGGYVWSQRVPALPRPKGGSSET